MKLIDILVHELPKRGGWPVSALSIAQDSEGHAWGYNCEHLTLQHHGWWRSKSGDAICTDGIKLYQMASDWNSTFVTREQYESALAASEGWIEWGGGECPVEEGTLVDVRFRDGDDDRNIEAIDLLWNHENWSADIIAYRLHCDINSRANDERLEQDLNECIGQDVDVPEWNGEGLPPVGCECEVKSGDTFADYDWVKIKVAYSHMGELIGIVDMPGESIHNDMEKLSYWYCGAIFRPLRTESEKAREKLAASLHIAAGASPIELNGIGPLYFKLADAIISGSVFGTTFKAGK